MRNLVFKSLGCEVIKGNKYDSRTMLKLSLATVFFFSSFVDILNADNDRACRVQLYRKTKIIR